MSIINELAHSDDRHYHSYYDGEIGPFFAHTFFNHQDKYSYISTEYAIELLLFGVEESLISRYGDLKLDIRNYIKKRKSYDYGPSSDFPEHAARALYLLGDSWIYKYLCDEAHYTEEVRKSHPFLELLLLSSRLAKRSNEQEYPL